MNQKDMLKNLRGWEVYSIIIRTNTIFNILYVLFVYINI